MMTKYAFDVWYSDGNDRQCIGVVGIQTGETQETASWMALDKALKQYATNPSEWSCPYADSCAVRDYSEADDALDDEVIDSLTESLSIEYCENPETDYYHHGRASLESLCS